MKKKQPLPAFCSSCGSAFDDVCADSTEFHCKVCGNMTYLNATGVANVLIPHRGGLIIQRRNIYPGFGLWSLPGGHVMLGETWRVAAAREAEEETMVTIPEPEKSIGQHYFDSSVPTGHLVLFGIVRYGTSIIVREFVPNREATERSVATRDDWTDVRQQIAFPLHVLAMDLYFAER